MGVVTSSSAERRRILVVDDVELNRILTEAVLRGATYEVDSVEDGAAALAALDAKPYDLVLLDLEMPGLDGHQAAAAIRRQSDVRLAALSSHGEPDARRRSAEVGMAAHIARPIGPRALISEIERVFCQPHQARAEPWQRHLYAEWTSRLGHERMRGFLLNLRDQLALLDDLADDGEREELHKVAHDLASTAGMLGFLEVTSRCRAVLEGEAADEPEARDALQVAINDAIDCLDHHFATERRGAA